MEETKARRAAEALLSEHKTGVQFKTLDPGTGLASMPDAYDIQDKYVDLLRAEHGAAIGYKVGLTSKTMQTFCGIDHPIGGVVLAKRKHQSGATIRRADYGRPGDSDDACGGRAAYRGRLCCHRDRRRSRGGLQPTRREVAGRG